MFLLRTDSDLFDLPIDLWICLFVGLCELLLRGCCLESVSFFMEKLLTGFCHFFRFRTFEFYQRNFCISQLQYLIFKRNFRIFKEIFSFLKEIFEKKWREDISEGSNGL